MKKIVTVFVLVLSVVMLLSLSACGEKKTEEVAEELPVVPVVTEAPAKEEEVAKDEPAANIDPAVVNMGQAIDEKHTADAWYKDGVEGGDYIYFEKADNSDLGLAYVKMENGERASTVLCAVNAELHVVDAEAAEGESSIDIVFVDEFKAYDYKSETWYVRGDPAALSVIFADIAFVNQDDSTNTLILNADCPQILIPALFYAFLSVFSHQSKCLNQTFFACKIEDKDVLEVYLLKAYT